MILYKCSIISLLCFFNGIYSFNKTGIKQAKPSGGQCPSGQYLKYVSRYSGDDPNVPNGLCYKCSGGYEWCDGSKAAGQTMSAVNVVGCDAEVNTEVNVESAHSYSA